MKGSLGSLLIRAACDVGIEVLNNIKKDGVKKRQKTLKNKQLSDS
tara:strand:+ start:283 stop:417 length:135 start_codon:yes stop_codon:yes gene_type:complete